MIMRRVSVPALGKLAVIGSFTAALLSIPTQGFAAPILTADLASFAVLGATGVTNVPTSTIGGNLGATNPSVGGGYDFTGGSLQANTPLAAQGQIDLDAAILAVNAFGPGLLLGSDLTGTILPGTYTVPAAATNLSGDLILDGNGSNTAVWAFLFPSTLITSTTSNVIVQNVGDGSGVGLYWSVGSAATLNGNTFAGNVLAQTLISSDGNLTMNCGRLLSATSQVTLIQDTVSTGCTGTGAGSNGFDQGGGTTGGGDTGGGDTGGGDTGGGDTGGGDTGGGDSGGPAPVPEPASLILLASGLAGALRLKNRRKGSILS